MTDPNVPMDRKKIVKGTAIAGNVVTTFTVPAGERWLLLNASIILTTDATVVNRTPRVRKRDSAATTIINIPSNVVAASVTAEKYWSREVSATSTYVNALGFQILDAAEDVSLYVSAGVVGDAYDYTLEYLKVEI